MKIKKDDISKRTDEGTLYWSIFEADVLINYNENRNISRISICMYNCTYNFSFHGRFLNDYHEMRDQNRINSFYDMIDLIAAMW